MSAEDLDEMARAAGPRRALVFDPASGDVEIVEWDEERGAVALEAN